MQRINFPAWSFQKGWSWEHSSAKGCPEVSWRPSSEYTILEMFLKPELLKTMEPGDRVKEQIQMCPRMDIRQPLTAVRIPAQGGSGEVCMEHFLPSDLKILWALSMTEVALAQKLLCIIYISLTLTVFQRVSESIAFKLGSNLKIFKCKNTQRSGWKLQSNQKEKPCTVSLGKIYWN